MTLSNCTGLFSYGGARVDDMGHGPVTKQIQQWPTLHEDLRGILVITEAKGAWQTEGMTSMEARIYDTRIYVRSSCTITC